MDAKDYQRTLETDDPRSLILPKDKDSFLMNKTCMFVLSMIRNLSFFHAFMFIINLTSYIQIFIMPIFLSFYMASQQPSDNLIIRIMAFVLRFLYLDISYEAQRIYTLYLFLICCIIWLFYCHTFFFRKGSAFLPNSIYDFLVIAGFSILNFVFPMSCCIIVIGITRLIQKSSAALLVTGVFIFVETFAARYVIYGIVYCSPVFVMGFGSTWVSTCMIPAWYIFFNCIFMETVINCPFRIVKLIIIGLMAIMSIFQAIRVIIHVEFITLFTGISMLSLYVIVSIMFIATCVGNILSVFDHSLYLILLIFIPVILITNLVISKRVDSLIYKFKQADDNQNPSLIKSFNSISFASSLCHALSLAGTNMNLFHHGMEKYPDSYRVAKTFARFIAATGRNEKKLINYILTELQKRASSYFDNVSLVIFYIIFRKSDDDGDGVHQFKIVVEDFLNNLHLFWTEVLLGRMERLASLAFNINTMFDKINSIHDQIKSQHLENNDFIEEYNKFKSSVKIEVGPKNKMMSFEYMHQVILEDSNKLFCKQQETVEYQQGNQHIHFNSGASMLQSMARTKMFIVQSLLYFIPIIFMYSMGVVYAIFTVQADFTIRKSWKIYQHLSSILNNIGAIYFLLPYKDESSFGCFNSTVFPKYVNDEKMFYKTKLNDMENDLKDLITSVQNELPIIYTEMNSFYLSGLFDQSPAEAIINTNNYSQKTNVSIIPFMNIMFIRIMEYYQNHSYTNLLNDDLHIDFISSTSYFMKNVDVLTNDLDRIVRAIVTDLFHNFLYSAIISAILLLILGAFLLGILNMLYSMFFKPFIMLPKTAVAELLDDLGSRLSIPQVIDKMPNEDKYHFRMLTSENPPFSYLRISQMISFMFLHIFISQLVIVVLFFPISVFVFNKISITYRDIGETQSTMMLPFYFFELGHYILDLEIDKKYNNGENFEEITHILIDKIQFIYENISGSIGNKDYTPSYIDTNEFLNLQPCNITNPKEHVSKCFSIFEKSKFISISTYNLFSNNIYEDPICNSLTDDIIGNILSITQSFLPVFDDFFGKSSSQYDEQTFNTHLIIFAYFFLACAFILITNMYIPTIQISSNFSTAILSSIPSHLLSEKASVIDVIKPKKIEVDMASKILNTRSTFEILLDAIILVDSDDLIIAETPTTLNLLKLTKSIARMDFKEFMCNLFHEDDIDFLYEDKTIRALTATLSDRTELIMVVTILNTSHFSYMGTQVSYACILHDITLRENMIKCMNQEANKLRMLSSQILPVPIADIVLSNSEFTQFLLAKTVIAFIAIKHIKTKEQAERIHEILRSILAEDDALTFVGRSIQIFKVVAGLFTSMITVTEMTLKVVRFTFKFVEMMKESGMDLDVQCGIHMSGPFLADLISDPNPYFDIYGPQMMLALIMVTVCPPNQVNITREVYDAIYDEGFDVTFIDEIEMNTSESIRVYHLKNPIIV